MPGINYFLLAKDGHGFFKNCLHICRKGQKKRAENSWKSGANFLHRTYLSEMNSENFHEYLKNPSKLHQVSYQELKSLVLQYPFSPNLRYMLLLKSLLDHHKDYERNLTAAAVYSVDRSKLYGLMKHYDSLREAQENYAFGEEYLELKDLSILEDAIEEPHSDIEDVPLMHQVKQEDPKVEHEDFEEMSDQELQAFFQEEEGLDFLEELFEGPNEVDTGHSSADPDHTPESMAENEDQPTIEDLEALGGMPEQEDAHAELPGEIPFIENDLNQGQEEADAIANNEGGDSHLDDLQDLPETDPAETAAIPGEEQVEMPSEGEVEALFEETTQSDRIAHLDEAGEENNLANSDLEDILQEAGEQNERQDSEPVEMDEDILAPQAPIPFEITNEEEEAPVASEEQKKPQPIPKDTYNTWLQKLRPPTVSILEDEPVADDKKSAKSEEYDEEGEGKAKQIAQKSIIENSGIATETLAAVLAMQGHKEKAIAMYERLSLQYPEKSSFFAAKIKELKK